MSDDNILIDEIKGDLFGSSDSLAHCVSRDFSMGAGIAVTFSKIFKGKDELKNQNVNIGEVAWLLRSERYVYYLVTKEKYWNKPTYSSIRESIQNLFVLCIKHNVKCLSIPKLGCGLDRLEWDKVKQIIIEEWPPIKNFKIKVYYL